MSSKDKNKEIPSLSITSKCNECQSDLLENALKIYIPYIKCHAYCFKCFKTIDLKHNKIKCRTCKKYYEKISKPLDKKDCNLCRTKRKYISRICNKHNYCSNCLEFLKLNNWTAYESITGCSECPENIINWLNIFKSNETEGCNYCRQSAKSYIELCNKHKYCEKCMESLKYTNSPSHKNIRGCFNCSESILRWIEIFKETEKNSKLIKTAVTFTCNMCKNKFENQDYINICSNHNYCEICIESLNTNMYYSCKSITDCQICFKKFNELTGAKINLNNQNKLVEETKVEEPKASSAQSNKSVKVNTIKNGLENRECLTETQDYSLNNDISRGQIINSQSIYIIITCQKCKKLASTIAFLCDHNICKDCLSDSCRIRINKYLDKIRIDPKILQKKFSYRCPICKTRISVPTLMILKHLNLDISIYASLIPYLDGIIDYS